MYEVMYQPEAAAELNGLRAFDRARLLDAVAKNLTTAPSAVSGKKKRIDLGEGDFIRQLRVAEFRLFYDVDEVKRLVIVRH